MMKRYDSYRESGVQWLGEVPEHWTVKKLKYVARLRSGDSITSESIGKEGEFPVYGGNGLRGYTSGYTHEGFYALIGRQGALCGNVNYADGKFWASEHAVVVSILENHSTYWLGELLRTMNLNQYSVAAAQPGLAVDTIQNLYIPVPSEEEQLAIANFLGDKTSQIDFLIQKKQQLIALLEEEKTAVINEAVTKGLNPDAPMKDSGIEWLGVVPAHWEVVRLTKYLESIVDYRGRTPEKTDNGVFLVTAKNIKAGIINYNLSTEYVSVDESELFMRRGSVEVGDVLFTTEAPLGEVANVDRTDICLAQRIIKFRAKADSLSNYFLKFWMQSHSFQNDLQSYATGSTALGIKASKLNYLTLVLPPLEEQGLIVNHIEESIARLNITINQIKQETDLLQEYRTALISEAVTGKIDVRDYQPEPITSTALA